MYEPPVMEPKIQQMFESSPDVSAAGGYPAAGSSTVTSAPLLRRTSGGTATGTATTTASTALPDVNLRPDSAARTTSRVRSAGIAPSGVSSAAATAAATSAGKSTKKYDFPLTPQQALEKYRRCLSNYEQAEILKYPQVYFLGALARKVQAAEGKGPNQGFDDDKGRYKCVKNDHIAYRYEVLKGLGKGSFGDVVKAYDHKTKTHTALKIIRNEKRFHKQGQVEVKILDHIKKLDKRNSHSLIHVEDFFLFRNHLCITFELLHSDLYSALKKDNFKGFRLEQVKTFATSVLSCLRLLRRNRIIHCDLKPENILLCRKGGDEVKVIDFGSACFDHQKVHSYIQSRFYRSPEVILGMSYTTAIDMWSLGCILSELITGHPIFPGRDEKEQLMLQMEVLGVPPEDWLAKGKRRSVFFDSAGNARCLTDRKGRTHLPGTKSLAQATGVSDPDFLDFLAGCLRWDTSQRFTPREASHHPWITGAADVDPPIGSKGSPTTGLAAKAAAVVGRKPRKLSRSLSDGVTLKGSSGSATAL